MTNIPFNYFKHQEYGTFPMLEQKTVFRLANKKIPHFKEVREIKTPTKEELAGLKSKISD